MAKNIPNALPNTQTIATTNKVISFQPEKQMIINAKTLKVTQKPSNRL